MNKKASIYLVSGVPASGKTTVVNQLLAKKSAYLFYDIDWLLYSGSALSGKDIQIESSTWPAYNAVWVDVLSAAAKNNYSPVLFSPWDNRDVREMTLGDHFSHVHWLMLDCEDVELTKRLKDRRYTIPQIDSILADAAYLRDSIEDKLLVAKLTAAEVAEQVLEWVESTGS